MTRPFNSNRNYSAPIGSKAKGASFRDVWRESDVKEDQHNHINDCDPLLYEYIDIISGSAPLGTKYYLIFMAIRLLEMHRILKDTGSIYLHCDPTMSHYLKLLLDFVFGQENFRNEIVWCYHGPGSPRMRQFNRKSDSIFWYSKGKSWIFNANDVRIPHKDGAHMLVGTE